MVIDETALQHWIENFYGFGSWKAKIWFVGFEESGGDSPQEVAEKINYFKNNPGDNPDNLCNIRDLYRKVAFRTNGTNARAFTNLFEHRFDDNAVLHGTWKNLILFKHGFRDQQRPDLLTYQKKTLASLPDNNEALIQLYPLPAHNHAWYYSWLELKKLIFLQDRTRYEEHVFPARMKRIFNNVSVYKPDLVLMYGMENINKIKSAVQVFFPGAAYKMIKAIKREIPQHHFAALNGTKLVITTQIPALHHNRIETGFDWYALGQSLKLL